LTVQSNISLNGNLLMELDRTNSPNGDQLLSIAGTIAAGGVLSVTNLGLPLHAGDLFHLFNQPAAGFASLSLPPLTSNLIWTNKLGVDGTIAVLSTASSAPVSLVAQLTGSNFGLSWPADHIGWHLQSQANNLETGLGTNWVDVIDSDLTNQFFFRVAPFKGTAFFRLVRTNDTGGQ